MAHLGPSLLGTKRVGHGPKPTAAFQRLSPPVKRETGYSDFAIFK
jgi:hypothetical protein